MVILAAPRADAASTVLRSTYYAAISKSAMGIPNMLTEKIRYVDQEISAQSDWIMNVRSKNKIYRGGGNLTCLPFSEKFRKLKKTFGMKKKSASIAVSIF